MFENHTVADYDHQRLSLQKLFQERLERLERARKREERQLKRINYKSSSRSPSSQGGTQRRWVRDHRLVDHDNSEEPATRKRKKVNPDDTYEHWNQEKTTNKDILAAISSTNGKNQDENVIDVLDQDEDENSSDEDSLQTPNTLADRYNVRRRIQNRDIFRDGITTKYVLTTEGYEILPIVEPLQPLRDSRSRLLTQHVSSSKRHFQTVNKLLHLNILRRKWELAYKCFAILVRHPMTDIRSIWPLGLEAMTRCAEQKHREAGVSDHTLRTFGSLTKDQMEFFKDEHFLQWLQTFYPAWNVRHNIGLMRPVPFRAGTKDTPPMYVITLIWTMLLKAKFDSVNDKLSQLMMYPPYMEDGMCHFLQGLSYQFEAMCLSKQESNDTFTQIEELITKAEEMFKKAKSLGAVFPESLLRIELNIVKKTIAQEMEEDLSVAYADDSEGSIGGLMEPLNINEPIEDDNDEFQQIDMESFQKDVLEADDGYESDESDD